MIRVCESAGGAPINGSAWRVFSAPTRMFGPTLISTSVAGDELRMTKEKNAIAGKVRSLAFIIQNYRTQACCRRKCEAELYYMSRVQVVRRLQPLFHFVIDLIRRSN